MSVRANFAPESFVETQLGIQDGDVEITGAVCRIHQYPENKKTHEQSNPFCCVQLKFARLNKDGEKIEEDNPPTYEYGLGGQNRDDWTQMKFRPGKADGPDDQSPDDLEIEVGTEGNTVLTDEGAGLNKKAKYALLVENLVTKGFKPEIIKRGYLPDLVGMRGHVYTQKLEKSPNSLSDKDPTVLLFDKITVFPYDKKAKGKSASAPAAAAEAKAAPVKANGKDHGNGDAADALALGALKKLQLGELKGMEDVERKRLQTKIQGILMRDKINVRDQQSVLNKVKDDDWLANAAAELSFLVDLEAGTVTFPE